MTTSPAPATRAQSISSGSLRVELTSAGDVRSIFAGDLLVNQYRASVHDSMPGGILLRAHRPDGQVEVAAVTGSAPSVTSFELGENRAAWASTAFGTQTRVELTVSDESLVWRTTVDASDTSIDSSTWYDLVHAQDMSLAPPAAALSSEAYVCHYLLHRVYDHESAGPVLVSRQTMSALPNLPRATSFLVEGASGFLTDSIQVYSAAARRDGVPHGLARPVASEVVQFEYAMPTLVSHPLDMSAGVATVHAVTAVAVHDALPLENALGAVAHVAASAVAAALEPQPLAPATMEPSALRIAPILAGHDLTDAELLAVAGVEPNGVLMPEYDEDGSLLSFFTAGGTHVVAGRKDALMERSHGHVLKAGDRIVPGDDVLSATAFAPGVFASHLVLGNTSMNRVATVHRHHLNLVRASGLRVLVDDGQGARLLGLPSALVLDVGAVRWIYETPVGRIEVVTAAHAKLNRLDVAVHSERPLSVTATIEIEGDSGTWAPHRVAPDTVVLSPGRNTAQAHHYPDLRYGIRASGKLAMETAAGSDADEFVARRVSYTAHGTHLVVALSGSLSGESDAVNLLDAASSPTADFSGTREAHVRTVLGLVRDLRFPAQDAPFAAELDALVPWYAHNALIHFLVPHGLEQYSGAAWGTRDVCQGPFELMLAGGHPEIAREILLRVFARQRASGEFPQWFMFDAYSETYNDGSHGDVIVWPLFALAQYLEATGDIEVLSEHIPFWDHAGRRPFAEGGDASASLLTHVERIFDFVDRDRLPGTALPAYGEGDWDDTLQPADPTMRTHLASTWTSALLVQAATLLSSCLADSTSHAAVRDRADQLATAVRSDLRERALVDGVMAGYVSHEGGHDRLIIHPSDTDSGMNYRLIPMTRSIISGIFTADEAASHESLIDGHLHFPDGVRLMDRPAAFTDGIPHTFLRAEQSANVGREIGLMYVHAHIRYVEALAALGRTRALDELLRISPIGIDSRLPHAARRQRNAYFSSSDGAFDSRESFAAGFEGLRDGSVKVRGGWRVYSSGPGIYLRQLVQNVLGIAVQRDHLIVDPVLPREADELHIQITIGGLPRDILFRRGTTDRVSVAAGDTAENACLVASEPRPGAYRVRGVAVRLEDLDGMRTLVITFPTPEPSRAS